MYLEHGDIFLYKMHSMIHWKELQLGLAEVHGVAQLGIDAFADHHVTLTLEKNIQENTGGR